jgi:hypothetical protein
LTATRPLQALALAGIPSLFEVHPAGDVRLAPEL